MDQITPPFTQEQVDGLNQFQQSGKFHPFTCCSPQDIPECERVSGKSEGVLIATGDGWVCPCGKYTQDWAHAFMSK